MTARSPRNLCCNRTSSMPKATWSRACGLPARRSNCVSTAPPASSRCGTIPSTTSWTPRQPLCPFAYSQHEVPALAACRACGTAAPAVIELAADLARQAGNNTLAFLDTLSRFLHTAFEKTIRDQGAPQSPELTLAQRRGACRDLTLLFIALCREQGLAARFVSGYQARSETRGKRRYLHAWPEVYIPGGGWRGYDPGHGTAVADAHVALTAACSPAWTLPIEGSCYGAVGNSEMHFDLSIRTDS